MSSIIAVHDISGVGRCSLTAALAVLPAFGHTCHPMPTAVLSQQTGFGDYTYHDMTGQMLGIMSAWKGLKLAPSMIYTGFLGNGKQAHLLTEFIEEYSGALVVVDPVMGDNESIYGCFDSGFVKDMSELAKHADILLPNTTEFNLLCERPLTQPLPENKEKILELARNIKSPRLKYIVITSGIGRCGSCNILVDLIAGSVSEIPCENSGVSYSGAGDLFASVMCAFIANGKDIAVAVKLAADFISKAVKNTPKGSDTRYGINYEPLLAKFVSEQLDAAHDRSP